jgi:hypothetical protein
MSPSTLSRVSLVVCLVDKDSEAHFSHARGSHRDELHESRQLARRRYRHQYVHLAYFEALLTPLVKNTVNVYAKTSPHVLDPPAFALDLGLHFVNKYEHISKAFIDITSHRWSRIKVGGKDHKWSFVRDGDEKGTVECAVDGSAGEENVTASLKCGLKDLLGRFAHQHGD